MRDKGQGLRGKECRIVSGKRGPSGIVVIAALGMNVELAPKMQFWKTMIF
jgi:hypothetical protein